MTTPVVTQIKVSDPNSPSDVMARGRGTEKKSITFPIGLTSPGAIDFGPYMEISAFEYERKIQTNDSIAERMFTVRLPLPANLNSTFDASYNQIQPGLKGAAFDVMGGEGTSGAITGAAGTALLTTAINTARSKLAKAGPGGQVLDSFIDEVTSEDIRSLASAASGIAINPRMETIFNGMNVRSHGFNFTLIPRNAQESLEIKKLIKNMTAAMHPDTFEADPVSTVLKYPYEFVVSFFDADGKRIDVLPTIPDCFLSNFATIANPLGQTRLTMTNEPVAFQISMQFIEGVSLVKRDLKYLSAMYEDESL